MGAMESERSGQVAIWTAELMVLADGLEVGVKRDFSWSLIIRRNGTDAYSDRKSKLRKPIRSSIRVSE